MRIHPVIIIFFILFCFMWGIRGCEGGQRQLRQNTQTTINVFDSQAADGLDLASLGAVIKEAKNAKEIEKKINQPGGINNLDLNGDGQVDYLKVTEYGNKKDEFGFSLTTEVEKDQEQEVATIDIVKTGEKAEVSVRGNQNIYGSGANHYFSHGIGTFLLWSYLLSPHPFFYSPFGFYPAWYSPYPMVSRNVYQNRASTYRNNIQNSKISSPTKNANIKSPNANKTAEKGIKRSLKNPSQSQKSFLARSKSSAVRSGGFGRAKNNSFGRNSSSRWRSSSYSGSRSYGGFGK